MMKTMDGFERLLLVDRDVLPLVSMPSLQILSHTTLLVHLLLVKFDQMWIFIAIV